MLKSIKSGFIFQVLGILFIMAGSLTNLSFAQTAADLAGSWKGTEFSFQQLKGPDISAMIEGGKSLHIGGMLALNDNMTYQIKDPQGTVNGKGKWILEKEGFFTTYEPGGEKTEYQIVTLDQSTLVTKHKVAMETPDGAVEGEIMLTYKK
jgi:hypothetical protein